ncbi:MAG: 50S ribosomal protein L3 N(5)-glutamine methyltransferase [Methylococcales bacterium]
MLKNESVTENLSPPEGLTTIRDFIRWGASRFSQASLSFGHGTDNALDEARWLVLHSLDLPWNLSNDYLSSVLTIEERLAATALIGRRIRERKPAAYLTGQAVFAGLQFTVDERVLVPRSPIAELIEQGFEPWLDASSVRRVLDLGAGSGCIAIACAFAFPNALIDAVDLSAGALEVAALNVAKHGLEERVELIESDLYTELPDRQYDLIVSNPPYVRRSEWEALPHEYHAEPEIGLHGGESGLDCVRRILTGAGRRLTENGLLVVEVGSSAQALLESYPGLLFVWPDFERGGDGVFLLSAEQLYAFDAEDRI